MKQHATTAELLPKENKTNFTGKLIVFTSFYDYKGHAPYIQSMIALAIVLERVGIRWDYWPVMGDFHIERCINEAYTRFYNDPEATDILCIDSDESFDVSGVLRMISHPEEIVAGVYRMKNNWQNWTGIWTVDEKTGQPKGKILPDGTALLEAYRVPWGFLRIKKTALQRYIEHYPDLKYGGKNGDEYIFCQQEYRDNQFFSQDYVFSERLKAAGCKLWIDPNITIGHWGNIEHSGNLDQHLRALKNNQDEAAKTKDMFRNALNLDEKTANAFATVSAMAKEIEQRRAA